jgi:hypothetical protein
LEAGKFGPKRVKVFWFFFFKKELLAFFALGYLLFVSEITLDRLKQPGRKR